jgi:hypothetical protein
MSPLSLPSSAISFFGSPHQKQIGIVGFTPCLGESGMLLLITVIPFISVLKFSSTLANTKEGIDKFVKKNFC